MLSFLCGVELIIILCLVAALGRQCERIHELIMIIDAWEKQNDELMKEGNNGKWIYPDGTMREFVSPADILSYLPAEKSEPKFAKVKEGDWVLIDNGKQGKISHFCSDDLFQDNSNAFVLHDYMGRWAGYHKASSITRILQPSEVVLDFGSFKGRVGTSYHTDGTIDDDSFVVFYNDNDNYIDMEYAALLDPATAKIIRELIQKQGENNG
jgi:hypothetical protein